MNMPHSAKEGLVTLSCKCKKILLNHIKMQAASNKGPSNQARIHCTKLHTPGPAASIPCFYSLAFLLSVLFLSFIVLSASIAFALLDRSARVGTLNVSS